MSLTLYVTIPPNPTGLGDGQSAAAYLASRFGSAPATNTAVPGGGDDGGGVQSSLHSQVAFTCASYVLYYVAIWDPADTSNAGGPSIYWTPALFPDMATSAQPFSNAGDQASLRSLATSAVAAASAGQALPQATITVGSTAGFLAAGYILVPVTGAAVVQLVAYTGKTATTFTGCTGGSGTINTTAHYVFQGYQNSGTRRRCDITVGLLTAANGDACGVQLWSMLGGSWRFVGSASVVQHGANAVDDQRMVGMDVDANGIYGAYQSLAGGGVATLATWMETND